MKTIAWLLAFGANLAAQQAVIQLPGAGRVVGKPYSATQVTHSVQTLANGAHIDQTHTNLIYQDDQGRQRIEMTAGNGKSVVIVDNVAAVIYTLDTERKTAQKRKMGSRVAANVQKIAGDVSPLEEPRAGGRDPNETVEDLGSQYINGVLALGVRITTAIPMGAIGNDQELKAVHERWYSNDIHALVKTVSTDPRSGTTTYELTNIVRSNPDPSLFQVPAGYTVEQK